MPSKSQQAYDWLSERIRTREFEPGHRLVLSSIAEALDISVVPVREAIRQLEAEGYVTYERNIGAKVTALNREAYFDTMEIVATLEATATALAAPHVDAATLSAARELNARMAELPMPQEADEFTRLNREFHITLFAKCPNRRLVELLEAQWEKLEHHRVSTFRYVPDRAHESVAEHAYLLDLIEAKVEFDYLARKAREHRMNTAESYRRQMNPDHPTDPHS